MSAPQSVSEPSAGPFKFQSSRLKTVASLTRSDGRPVHLLGILNTFMGPPRLLVNGSVLTMISIVDPSCTDPRASKRDLLLAVFQNEPSAVPPRPLCPGDILLLEDVEVIEFRNMNYRLTTRGRFKKLGQLVVHSGQLTAPASQHPSTMTLAADVATLRQWWHKAKDEVRRLQAVKGKEMEVQAVPGKSGGGPVWMALFDPPLGLEPEYPYPSYQPSSDATVPGIAEPGAYNVACKVIQVSKISVENHFALAITVTDGGVLPSPLQGQSAVSPSGHRCHQSLVLPIPRPLLWNAQFLEQGDNIIIRNLLVGEDKDGKLRAHLESPHAALVWFMEPGEQDRDLERRVKEAACSCCPFPGPSLTCAE